MSRAFVNEDAGEPPPRSNYQLPDREDPDFSRAAARALLEGARVGDVFSAEEATGYRWGDPALRRFVEKILNEADDLGDDRLAQVAERYLRQASKTTADG